MEENFSASGMSTMCATNSLNYGDKCEKILYKPMVSAEQIVKFIITIFLLLGNCLQLKISDLLLKRLCFC